MSRIAAGIFSMTAGWAVWRLFAPDRSPSYGSPQVRPVKLAGRSVFVREREFFVREVGSREDRAVVLIHGLGFDGEMTFFKIAELLAIDHHVVIPDMRSHGKSDRIRGVFDIEDLADDVVGILEAIEIDPPVAIFGYSMGGMVAQAIAARYPDRCSHVILGATAVRPMVRFRMPLRLILIGVRAAMRISTVEPVLFNFRYLERSGAIEAHHRRWMWDALRNRDASLYFEAALAVWRFDGSDLIGSIDQPVLQLITVSDRVVAPSAQHHLAQRLGNVTIVELGSGHEAVLTRHEEIVAEVRGFLVGSRRDSSQTPETEPVGIT